MTSDKTICGNCASEAPKLFTTRDRNRAVTLEAFHYYRCQACGLVFLQPVPKDLGAYYPTGYHEVPGSVNELLVGSERENYKLEAVGGTGAGRRLLEIGPSFGRFAAMAKAAGFEVCAIEMDPACSRFLRDTVGISVELTENVASALPRLGRFDVVALWHSLEHLRDPWAVLDAATNCLNPGGLLAVATPNPGSRQFRLLGSRWIHLDAPRHLSLIPASVLETRLERRGMRRIHFSTRDQGARDCNVLGWVAALNSVVPRRLLRRPVTSVVYRVSHALAKFDDRDPFGSAYTVVYRKAVI